MKQGGLLDEGISPITICHTRVSSNEMFAERLLFVAARLDDAAPLPPPTIRFLHKSPGWSISAFVRSGDQILLEKDCDSDGNAAAAAAVHRSQRSTHAEGGGEKKNVCFFYYFLKNYKMH